MHCATTPHQLGGTRQFKQACRLETEDRCNALTSRDIINSFAAPAVYAGLGVSLRPPHCVRSNGCGECFVSTLLLGQIELHSIWAPQGWTLLAINGQDCPHTAAASTAAPVLPPSVQQMGAGQSLPLQGRSPTCRPLTPGGVWTRCS
eukprot:5619860-Amphidinium_carterae.1